MFESVFNLKIFEWIDEETVSDVIKNSEEKKFNKGELIMKEWDESNWEWYIIKSWSVSVKIWWEEVTTLKTWEIFWEIALLNEETRTASIEALTDLRVIVLTLENFINMINNDENKINKEIIRRIEENLQNS